MNYKGKVVNLKNRVSSYTRVTPDQAKTYGLVHAAQSLKFQELESELEALLTEAQLIKTYQPFYNIDLKDDKSPLYIVVTQEKYPRLVTARKKQLATIYKKLPKSNVYGPFNSGYAARQIIKIGRRIFKFCNMTPAQKRQNKPCFYTHIGQCSGACTGEISVKDYQEMIKHVKVFLSGSRKNLLKEIKTEMEQASEKQQFEKAAALRDQFQSLEYYYQRKQRLNFDPDIPQLGEDKVTYVNNRLSQLLHTAGAVPHNYKIERLEGYDISNTSGQLSTASMVVFENGKPNKSEYRRFRIKTIEGPNDPAMLREALLRRLNHPEWRYPDLFVIDGGKGQLRAAISAIQNKVPTVSIVKRPDRLLIPQYQNEKLTFFEVRLVEGNPITNLIQQIRDESHRFAKGYHSKLRRTHGMLK